jgi:hypothetical protein
MRNCLAVFLLAALYGCAAPPDLTESPDLSEADRLAAKRLAQQITMNCRYERSFTGNYYRAPVEMKYTEVARIRRLYTSPSGWYKAEYSADNVDGIAYQNPASRSFVCSASMWEKLPYHRTVTFTEVGRK